MTVIKQVDLLPLWLTTSAHGRRINQLQILVCCGFPVYKMLNTQTCHNTLNEQLHKWASRKQVGFGFSYKTRVNVRIRRVTVTSIHIETFAKHSNEIGKMFLHYSALATLLQHGKRGDLIRSDFLTDGCKNKQPSLVTHSGADRGAPSQCAEHKFSASTKKERLVRSHGAKAVAASIWEAGDPTTAPQRSSRRDSVCGIWKSPKWRWSQLQADWHLEGTASDVAN